MNRNNLYVGIGLSVIGIVLLIWALILNPDRNGILVGFGISSLISGIASIIRYFYWTQPGRREEYEERLNEEQIDSRDEFKNKIRALAIRYTYIAELSIISISIVALGIINQFYMIQNLRFIMIYLGLLLLFQLAFSTFMYKHFLNQHLK